MPPTFIILKTGSSYPDIARQRGDFEDWIIAAMGVPRADVAVVDAQKAATLPDPARRRALVVTGSHSMVTDRAAWSERSAAWLRTVVAAEWPVLGICFGHQLLAHAWGGAVGPGVEMGCAPATLTPAAADDPLLAALPRQFATMNGHFQAVLTLPPQATLLAATGRDPHHAYRIGRCAWGIQWHPELDADVLAEYVARERAELTAAEVDVDATLAALAPTPVARSVLPRFVEVARAALADRAQVTQQAA